MAPGARGYPSASLEHLYRWWSSPQTELALRLLRYGDFVWCGDRRIDYLAIVDGSLLGQGSGPSKGGAQEAAAGMTLANLLSSHETGTPS